MPEPPPADVLRAVVARHREAMGLPPLAPSVDETLAIARALAWGYSPGELGEAFEGAATSAVNRARGRRRLAWILGTFERVSACIGERRMRLRAPPKLRAGPGAELATIPIFDLADQRDASRVAWEFVAQLPEGGW